MEFKLCYKQNSYFRIGIINTKFEPFIFIPKIDKSQTYYTNIKKEKAEKWSKKWLKWILLFTCYWLLFKIEIKITNLWN